MKVCIIYYSWMNPLLFRDARAHLDRGDWVDVVCYSRADEEIGNCLTGLKIWRLTRRGYDEKYAAKYLLRICYFCFLASIKVLVSHLRKRYDMIYVVSPPDFMVISAIVPKLLGAKVIINIHDIVPEFYMRKFGVNGNHIAIKILKFIEKVACRFCDHVFTVTDIWRNKLIRRDGVPDSKCSVLMNVPDDRIVDRVKKKSVIHGAEFRLLYPGSLGEHFGVETLIRALPLVREEIPSVKLEIYGLGVRKKYLQGIARRLNVEGIIKFNKLIPMEELLTVMREADIGVVPTLDGIFSDEALSMKSLEFLAVGTPIVVSRTTSTEYYYDDSLVKFFRPGDHHDLADSIIELYRDPGKRRELAENAKTFNAKHSWTNYKKMYYRVVDSLFECRKECQ